MKIRSLINFGDARHAVGGINVHIDENGRYDFSFTVLKQEKDKVSLVATGHDISDEVALLQSLEPVLPRLAKVHVNIEGKGILFKTFPSTETYQDQGQLLKRLFPMVKQDTFISQVYNGSNTRYLHIARQDIFLSLERISKHYSIVSFSLGAFIVAPVIPLLQGDHVLLRHYAVRWQGAKIQEVSALPEGAAPLPTNMEDQFIPATSFLAYASAWSVLLGHSDFSFSPSPAFDNARAIFSFYAHVYKACQWALAILLGVLIINSAVYFVLQSRAAELESQVTLQTDRSQKDQVLQKQLRDLTKAYGKIGWSSNLQPLYYADRIAQHVHADLQLTSLQIGVPEKAMARRNKETFYQTDRIIVKGVTKNPLSLQQMLQVLERQPWVAKIDAQQYQHDSRQDRGVFQFNIHVK